MAKHTIRFLALALVGLAAEACGSHTSTKFASTPRGVFGTCVRTGDAPAGFSRVESGGAGSTVALAHWGKRTVAYVADEDQHAVYAIDVDSKRTLQKFTIDGRPAQLTLTRDARLIV